MGDFFQIFVTSRNTESDRMKVLVGNVQTYLKVHAVHTRVQCNPVMFVSGLNLFT